VRCITVQARYSPSALSSAAPGRSVTEAMLLPRTVWHVTSLYSLVPHFREFQALCNAYRLPEKMLRFLLSPSPLSGTTPNSTSSTSGSHPSSALASTHAPGAKAGSTVYWSRIVLPAVLRSALESSYNASQRDAIAACLDGGSQFTLVQVRGTNRQQRCDATAMKTEDEACSRMYTRHAPARHRAHYAFFASVRKADAVLQKLPCMRALPGRGRTCQAARSPTVLLPALRTACLPPPACHDSICAAS
jgi:hypothetical protein